MQISMFGVDEAQERHQAILNFAMSVVQNYINMRESALKLCVSLYNCRQEFEASGDSGWGAFCEKNFAQLGLSQGNIRSAVKAGRAIAHYLTSLQERGESAELARLESMSRSALIVLGEAPDDVRDELIQRVATAGEMRDNALSAREVEAELNRLRQEKAEAERGQADANAKLSAMDQALNRMNGLVRDRETQVGALQSQIDALQHQVNQAAKRTPVEVVDADPQSKAMVEKRKQDEREIQNMQRQMGELQHELTKAEADLGQKKAELEKIARQAAMRKQSSDAIDELEVQIARMKAQWSDAYAQKIRSQDPHSYAPVLTRIANDLRFLADQLDPALV